MQTCVKCKNEFGITEQDKLYYVKVNAPEPSSCPSCRDRARLVFRNERYYYPRTCDLCGKPMIAVHDPQYINNVYCHACWWSEKWDSKKFGLSLDFNRPFFDQYKELLISAPKLAMMNDNGAGSENCEYTYDISRGKNCYLVLSSWFMQDCMYSFQLNRVKDCIDCYFVIESELMYNCVNSEKCYNCQDTIQCIESRDCVFGFNLTGCSDCLFCAGLRHKQYQIWNIQYSKEDYFKKKREFELDSWEKREMYRTEFSKFILTIPRRFANFKNCEECTGDNLLNSKNAKECYNQRNLHNCEWMTNGDGGKDCYECYSAGDPELCYNCITPDNSYAEKFSVFCWKSQFITYSDNCHSSRNLFGCVGMKRNEYCILNKQYSREEYELLVPKIIEHMRKTGEWGEFFRPDICQFAYNETSAQEWHPIDELTALRLGYRWQKKLPGSFQKETISWDKIPDFINALRESEITKEIFKCVNCEKNYRILSQEFIFYKNNNIPLPRFCIDCRHQRRKKTLNPRKLWTRQCMCKIASHGHESQCHEEFMTTYAPLGHEIVFCEKCYLKEVY